MTNLTPIFDRTIMNFAAGPSPYPDNIAMFSGGFAPSLSPNGPSNSI